MEALRRGAEEILQESLARLWRLACPDTPWAAAEPVRERMEQAARLRQDLWLYRRMLQNVVENGGSDEALRRLRDFCIYFSHTSGNLLRYGDEEGFERFRRWLFSFGAGEVSLSSREEFLAAAARFLERVTTLYDVVCRRSILREIPPDEADLARRLEVWMKPL